MIIITCVCLLSKHRTTTTQSNKDQVLFIVFRFTGIVHPPSKHIHNMLSFSGEQEVFKRDTRQLTAVVAEEDMASFCVCRYHWMVLVMTGCVSGSSHGGGGDPQCIWRICPHCCARAFCVAHVSFISYTSFSRALLGPPNRVASSARPTARGAGGVW